MKKDTNSDADAAARAVDAAYDAYADAAYDAYAVADAAYAAHADARAAHADARAADAYIAAKKDATK